MPRREPSRVRALMHAERKNEDDKLEDALMKSACCKRTLHGRKTQVSMEASKETPWRRDFPGLQNQLLLISDAVGGTANGLAGGYVWPPAQLSGCDARAWANDRGTSVTCRSFPGCGVASRRGQTSNDRALPMVMPPRSLSKAPWRMVTRRDRQPVTVGEVDAVIDFDAHAQVVKDVAPNMQRKRSPSQW